MGQRDREKEREDEIERGEMARERERLVGRRLEIVVLLDQLKNKNTLLHQFSKGHTALLISPGSQRVQTHPRESGEHQGLIPSQHAPLCHLPGDGRSDGVRGIQLLAPADGGSDSLPSRQQAF